MTDSDIIKASNLDHGSAAYVYADTARRQMRSAEGSLSCALSVLDGLRELGHASDGVYQTLMDISTSLDECVTRLNELKGQL